MKNKLIKSSQINYKCPKIAQQIKFHRLYYYKTHISLKICLRMASVSEMALIMAALCNRAGHYIFVLWFLSSSFFFFILFSLA